MSDRKKNKQLGTKWFTYYTKVRPWFACLAALSVVSDFAQYTDAYLGNLWLLLYFLAAMAQPVLSVIVFVKSKEDYVDLVRFVKKVLLFEILNIAYQQGVQQYINYGFQFGAAAITFVVIFVIGYFAWYRLNVKYFEKRIGIMTSNHLEYDPNCITECKACGYREKAFFDTCPICGRSATRYVYPVQNKPDEEDKICFCRKCGEKLLDGSRFCSKCGTEVICRIKQ